MKTAKIHHSVGHAPTDGQVKRVVRLNIGLNNNPKSVDTILRMVGLYADIDSHKIVEGEYNGDCEPTLVITALTDISLHTFDIFVGLLTGILTQECIAYKFGGKGVLKYNDTFDGERYDFDEQYFIN